MHTAALSYLFLIDTFILWLHGLHVSTYFWLLISLLARGALEGMGNKPEEVSRSQQFVTYRTGQAAAM